MHSMRYATTNDVLEAGQSHFEHARTRLRHDDPARSVQRRAHAGNNFTAPSLTNRAASAALNVATSPTR